MKCPKCKTEKEKIQSLENWLVEEINDGNLLTSEYYLVLDYMENHPNEVCCKDCFENLKGE